jgi:hypothetical protein
MTAVEEVFRLFKNGTHTLSHLDWFLTHYSKRHHPEIYESYISALNGYVSPGRLSARAYFDVFNRQRGSDKSVICDSQRNVFQWMLDNDFYRVFVESENQVASDLSSRQEQSQ